MESLTASIRRPGPAPKLSEERERELIAEYAKGVPILDMLLAFGISRPVLYKTLDKHGVPYGKRPRKNGSPVDLAVERGGVVNHEGGHVQSDVTPSAKPGATAEPEEDEKR